MPRVVGATGLEAFDSNLGASIAKSPVNTLSPKPP